MVGRAKKTNLFIYISVNKIGYDSFTFRALGEDRTNSNEKLHSMLLSNYTDSEIASELSMMLQVYIQHAPVSRGDLANNAVLMTDLIKHLSTPGLAQPPVIAHPRRLRLTPDSIAV
jgi:hypothetical protein